MYNVGLYTFAWDDLLGIHADFELHHALEGRFQIASIIGMGSLITIPSILLVFKLKMKLACILGWISIGLAAFYLILHFGMISIILTNGYPVNNIFLFIISVILLGGIIAVNIIITTAKFEDEDISLVKKTILELSTKFTRLSVKEISEKTKVDKDTIIRAITSMIARREIHAEYFKSTKMVSFDQQANVENFDALLKSFEETTEKKIDKLD
jgi:hypothetical protein